MCLMLKTQCKDSNKNTFYVSKEYKFPVFS